ncbi:3-hydroxybutyryl-CoA dehydrogenase [Streptomyces sp. A012304]|uniref:3-hydroxybutyryl-CoA dehydrogenase n=1 Tax=Streptomyces sp. A012304 TaxID=375446 RepID=UPI002852A647|nr:3-hydroxybutyryl-CoA dehydrogenase [Streptomyces sp. A012304]GKQ40771.1 3-hydroxybutyryl-CoA dehydrogenase [Streptomyces sp. A012304]
MRLPGTAEPKADIRRVGVVGCGLMGSGIAEVCARAGLDVVIHEVNTDAAEAGLSRIGVSFDRAVRRGKLSSADRVAALDRVRVTTDLTALSDRDLVVEAATEDEAVKVELFAELDRIVEREDALLASNTSSLPIMKLGVATTRPHQVIGVHFFNPVPVLELVEIVPSLLTAPQTQSRAEKFVTRVLGKKVIRAQDRAGFVVNALLVPYLLSAVRMLESGFASAEDIDTGMVLGCAHPMGPLSLADLIGLDTLTAIAEAMYADFKDPLHAPPPLLLRMVEAGLLGRKSGRGFHDYSDSKKGN